jgi:RHS repeat-associated protein
MKIIKEQKDYYPFGKEHENANLMSSTNRWNFSGKEKQTIRDLGWLDFSARMYANCEMPIFTTQDPLAEKYYSISPYAYCANNPLKYIDPTGMYYYDWNNQIYKTDAGNEVSWNEIVQNNYVEPPQNKTVLTEKLQKFDDFLKQSSLWTEIEKTRIYDIQTKKIEEGTEWVEGMPTVVIKGEKVFVVSTKTGEYVDVMSKELRKQYDNQLDSRVMGYSKYSPLNRQLNGTFHMIMHAAIDLGFNIIPGIPKLDENIKRNVDRSNITLRINYYKLEHIIK